MLVVIPAAEPLRPFVYGYWYVQDLEGAHAVRPIQTCPHPGAVLTVNFGRPNAMEGGPVVPRVSLLGLQTSVRRWRSWSDTYFVMVMMTVGGLASLFPGAGAACRDQLLELNSLVGDRLAFALADDLDAAWTPRRISCRLDRWLLDRLDATRSPPYLQGLFAAHAFLRAGNRVDAAAQSIGITRRQSLVPRRGRTEPKATHGH
jgi:hypothetical protein